MDEPSAPLITIPSNDLPVICLRILLHLSGRTNDSVDVLVALAVSRGTYIPLPQSNLPIRMDSCTLKYVRRTLIQNLKWIKPSVIYNADAFLQSGPDERWHSQLHSNSITIVSVVFSGILGRISLAVF